MDLSDIIYIICLALGIFAPIFQSRAKKKALEKTQRKPQSHPADEEYMPSPQDVYADNADEEYYDELPEEQPQVMTSLDDIFRALREGRPLVQAQVEQPIVIEKKLPDVLPHESLKRESTKLPEEGIKATTTSIMQDEISDSGVYADEPDAIAFDSENIDWRQAVVTSEILNRKY